MTDITDKGFKKDIVQQAEDMKKRAENQCKKVLEILKNRTS